MQIEVVKTTPKGKAKPAPLLFLHGMFHGAWCWEEYFLPYFTDQGYTCYAMSLRGHGNSEGRKQLWRTGINHYLQDLHQVVGQVKEETGEMPVLVGHSMGGSLVQMYMGQHEVPGGVLVAAGPPWGLLPVTLRVMRRHPLVFLKINLLMDMFQVVKTPQLFQDGFLGNISQEKLLEYHKMIGQESYRAYVELIALKRPRPGKVKSPVLVLGGEIDAMFPPSTVHGTAKAYNTDATIFPGMGHGLMVENGWQGVAEKISTWLVGKGW